MVPCPSSRVTVTSPSSMLSVAVAVQRSRFRTGSPTEVRRRRSLRRRRHHVADHHPRIVDLGEGRLVEFAGGEAALLDVVIDDVDVFGACRDDRQRLTLAPTLQPEIGDRVEMFGEHSRPDPVVSGGSASRADRFQTQLEIGTRPPPPVAEPVEVSNSTVRPVSHS